LFAAGDEESQRVAVGKRNPPIKKMAPAWGAEAKWGCCCLGSLASQAAPHIDSLIHICPQVYLVQKTDENQKYHRPAASRALS